MKEMKVDSKGSSATIPLVSVLMPVFNAEKFVGLSIKSILDQTYANMELLIFDDASTDKTLEIVKSFLVDTRVKLFKTDANVGYLSAINKLFEKASGDYIAFQDADDISVTSRIHRSLDCITNQEVDFISTGCAIINNNGSILRNITYPERFNHKRNNYLKCCGSSLFVKRELYDQYGGFNPYFNRIGSEDLEWATRLAQSGKYTCINEPLYMYRKADGSITTDVSSPLATERAISHLLVQGIVKKMFGRMHYKYWEDNEFQRFFKNLKSDVVNEEYTYPYNSLWRTIDAYLYQGKTMDAIVSLCSEVRRNPLKLRNIKLALKISRALF